jgi:hypothetical protein
MQRNSINQNSRVTFTQACSFSCAILFVGILTTSCGKKKSPFTDVPKSGNMTTGNTEKVQPTPIKKVEAPPPVRGNDSAEVISDVMTCKQKGLMYLWIHSFAPDGRVFLTGDNHNGMPLSDHEMKDITQTSATPIFILEGEAKVGDGATLIIYTETQTLSNGETRVIHPTHYGIQSAPPDEHLGCEVK